MNPLNAIGMLFQEPETGNPIFCGTAFSYLSPNIFITAAHCVSNTEIGYTLILGRLPYGADIETIIRHENADIAIIKTRQNFVLAFSPFDEISNQYGLGITFNSFGFPEDCSLNSQSKPTERLFVGYFQRFFTHNSHMGYSYDAAELNISCPVGLSGSPLFIRETPNVIYGIVCENIEVSTELREEEIESKPSGTEKYIYRKVITYGIALLLAPYEE